MAGPSNGRRLRLLLAAVALAGAAVDSAAAQQSPPSTSGPGPSYLDPKNFNPSMAIVMVVLITAFFLLGFFSIYLRRCAGPPLGGPDEYPQRPGGGTAYFTASRSTRTRTRGLDRAVLDSFPVMAYADVKAHKAGKGGALECAVCLSEFDDDEALRLLPRCAHAFHADCIDAWLASHVTCPVCRAVLVPDAAEAPALPPVPAAVQVDAPAAPRQPAPETATAATEQVAVVVVVPAEETEEERIRREEAAELMRIGSVKRALRSKSGRRPAQFPRSHTTGHSLAAAAAAPAAAAAAADERYTLRLPEHVLQEVVAASNLRRSASVQASSRTGGGFFFGGARGAGRSVRLGNSGRWPNMSQLARTFSARLPAWGGSGRRGEADVAPGKGAAKAAAGSDGKAAEQCGGGACPLGGV
ncbi:hypothetical protein EJB05_48644, partial [Eragrostis curvula]